MQFDSVSDFFAMGGHALYVWLAYGATFLVLVVNTLVLRGARKRQLERLRWQAQAANDEVQISETAGLDDKSHGA